MDDLIGRKFKGKGGNPMRVCKKVKFDLYNCVDSVGVMHRVTRFRILKALNNG